MLALNSMMKRSIVLTKDGTNSVYCQSTGEHFHSIHGALQESMHVYVEAGLAFSSRSENIKLLEIGFGTGLNAILSLIYARAKGIRIDYTGIELFPPDMQLAEQLNYFEMIDPSYRHEFLSMHEADEVRINFPNMHFTKLRHDMTTDFTGDSGFGLIYFDAFSPSVQPALWTEQVFRNIAQITIPGGVLVTYCSKVAVRRILTSAGFDVEKLPGPHGKREMIRATRL